MIAGKSPRRWTRGLSFAEKLATYSVPATDGSNCIMWTGTFAGPGRHKYGRLSIKGQNYKAHRLALEIKLGRPIKTGLFACHTCHNTRCINPDHLYEGDYTTNSGDAMRSGRVAHGVRLPNAKLSPAKVRFIRRSSLSGKDLAALFKVSPAAISMAKNRRKWVRVQ